MKRYQVITTTGEELLDADSFEVSATGAILTFKAKEHDIHFSLANVVSWREVVPRKFTRLAPTPPPIKAEH